jgi:hypothetical protein
MLTIGLSGAQVTHLDRLLAIVAAHAGDGDRYELHYCRSQLGRRMPAVEVLVLAGVLSEMTERPQPDAAVREDCLRWSNEVVRLLRAASVASPPPGPITAGERLAA